MDNYIYRGLTAEDLDMLIQAAISDFDLWGWYGDSKKLDEHIERVDKAFNQISETNHAANNLTDQ